MKLKKEQKPAPIIDWEVQCKRALADYANLVKRQDRERSATVQLANAILLEKILVVVDELELALCHQPNPGVQLTLDKLVKILKDEGCEPSFTEVTEGKKIEFDPQTMEAVEMVEGKKNRVIKVIKKGYQLNGQVLRPAGVVVGKGGDHE